MFQQLCADLFTYTWTATLSSNTHSHLFCDISGMSRGSIEQRKGAFQSLHTSCCTSHTYVYSHTDTPSNCPSLASWVLAHGCSTSKLNQQSTCQHYVCPSLSFFLFLSLFWFFLHSTLQPLAHLQTFHICFFFRWLIPPKPLLHPVASQGSSENTIVPFVLCNHGCGCGVIALQCSTIRK